MAKFRGNNSSSLLYLSYLKNNVDKKLLNKNQNKEKSKKTKGLVNRNNTNSNKPQPKITRNYGIDLERIISINSIIIFHFLAHGKLMKMKYNSP